MSQDVALHKLKKLLPMLEEIQYEMKSSRVHNSTYVRLDKLIKRIRNLINIIQGPDIDFDMLMGIDVWRYPVISDNRGYNDTRPLDKKVVKNLVDYVKQLLSENPINLNYEKLLNQLEDENQKLKKQLSEFEPYKQANQEMLKAQGKTPKLDNYDLLVDLKQEIGHLRQELAKLKQIQRSTQKNLDKSLELEKLIDNMHQENESLRQQLIEVSQREITYFSFISHLQDALNKNQNQIQMETYSNDKKDLLASLRRQYEIISKNLMRLKETKAQYGLMVPLDVSNGISLAEEELKRLTEAINKLGD